MKNSLYFDLKHKTFYFKINIKSFNMDLAAYIKGDTHEGSEKQKQNV